METAEIVQLPTEYKRSGFIHRQLRRGQFVFIYQVFTENGTIAGYEIFKRLVSKAGMAKFGGGPAVFVPAKERKPNDESFGKWAFNTTTEEKAIKYFDMLETAKGDLRVFFELRSPNPMMKVFELHDANGKPLSSKIMGKPVNKTVRVDIDDMEAAKAKAKEAFIGTLGANFDIRGWSPVFVREERMYGKTEDEEVDIDDSEDENED